MSNKNMKKILYVCFVFFVATLVYFFISNNTSSTPVQPVTSTSTVSLVLPIVRVESFTYATSSINLTVEYPQFVASASSSLEKMINTNLKKEAENIYNDQLKELQLAVTPESLPGESGREVFFQRKVQKDAIYISVETNTISVPYYNYVDTGGAHGTFFYTSETFDSVTGKKLALKDFMQGEYERDVFQEIKRQIMLGTSTETCVNCFKELSELEDIPVFVSDNFVLTDKGIVFLYSAYDLGPYALTSQGQEVLVSKDIVKMFISRVW